MAIYAKIKGTTIIDKIVANDGDYFDPAFSWKDITDYSPIPEIGWTTADSINFVHPGLPDDVYHNSIAKVTAGGFDIYTAGSYVFKFPAGTNQNVAYLSMAIQQNLAQFQIEMATFVTSRYSLDTRFNFIALYTNAQANALTNRLAYISQIFTWSNSIITYASTYVASVKALTNPATVATTKWDFSAFIASDPLINPLSAIQISN